MMAAADQNVQDVSVEWPPASSAPRSWATPGSGLERITATLHDEELWQQFHVLGTEMIITKTGRRMFPPLQVKVTGLEPEATYYVLMDMELAGDARLKYSGTAWSCAGRSEEYLPSASRLYLHPDSPATGAKWMSQPVSMQRAKLTNNAAQPGGHVLLTSMHRYQPRVHVVKTDTCLALSCSPAATFVFPQTAFIAVTAYQNDLITKLKIDNNPFAKGFRLKRKSDDSNSTTVSSCRHRGKPCSRDVTEDFTERPTKRPCSVQSGSSWTNDSGRSSLGSASSSMEDLNTQELHPFPGFQWEQLAMGLTAARTVMGYPPYNFAHLYRTHQLWRYPYLMPTPQTLPFPMSPFSYPYMPASYSSSSSAALEPYQKPGNLNCIKH